MPTYSALVVTTALALGLPASVRAEEQFDLFRALPSARCIHAATPLFLPCIVVDTAAGSMAKADSEMTAYSSAIHPDIVVIPRGWNGRRFWASFSPFPHLVSGMGNENPHVVCSDDGIRWSAHVGPGRFDVIKNPIDTRTRSRRFSFLSDPDLLLDQDKTMWLFYRGNLGTQPDTVFFMASNSRDGVRWIPPVVILSGDRQHDLCSPVGGLSPSFVLIDSVFHLWYINARSTPNRIYHLQSRSVTSGWLVTDSTNLGAERPPGVDIWHLNVVPSPDGALLGLFTFTDSATTGKNCRLTLAASNDRGATWIVNDAWLLDHAADRTSWDGNQIYRSGGYWDTENGESVFRLYYSGMRQAKVPIWGTGLTTVYFSADTGVAPPAVHR